MTLCIMLLLDYYIFGCFVLAILDSPTCHLREWVRSAPHPVIQVLVPMAWPILLYLALSK